MAGEREAQELEQPWEFRVEEEVRSAWMLAWALRCITSLCESGLEDSAG